MNTLLVPTAPHPLLTLPASSPPHRQPHNNAPLSPPPTPIPTPDPPQAVFKYYVDHDENALTPFPGGSEKGS